LTAAGFVRGEQFAEIVSRDPTTEDLNFYLLAFEQQCSYASAGCALANLLSDEVERDWTATQIIEAGHDAELVRRVTRLVDLAEYKRYQCPPGVRVTVKAFGRDRRLPITNAYRG
jgi:NH3-dependent NAD+ synthetase